jgi:osmotically-inducible protein OsmY
LNFNPPKTSSAISRIQAAQLMGTLENRNTELMSISMLKLEQVNTLGRQNHRNPEEEIEKKPIGGDDMDIFELVRDRFKHHPRLNQTQISLRVKSGAVTLRGEVSTDDAKQVAIDIVESLPGVTEVRNELSVNLGMR